MSPEPVTAFLFWTSSPNASSWLIRRVTKGEYSHVGIGFEFGDGSRVYYESLWQWGWTGPWLWPDLMAWSGQKDGRRIKTAPLFWLSPDEMAAIYHRAGSMVGLAGYGRLQIVSHWAWERLRHRWGGRMRNTPSRVTCGEGVSRVAYPDVDFRCARHDHWDSVTPQSIMASYRALAEKHSINMESTGR